MARQEESPDVRGAAEAALHNLLAKRLMTAIDVNKDGWMTFKEAVAFVGQRFSQWDADANGSMNASEFTIAFAQLMAPDPSEAPTGFTVQHFQTR